jgi:predicted 3-demethylubiquinone-9 3-methyltransferase (glyoxalase superfamily)
MAEQGPGRLKRPMGICAQRLIDAMMDPDRATATRAMDAMMAMHKIDIAAIEAARAGH